MNFAKIKTFFRARFSSWQNIAGTICLLAFLALLVMEVITLKASVGVIFSSDDLPPDTKTTKGVRLDFGGYQSASERVEKSYDFKPGPTVESNPFRPRPKQGAE